MHLHMFIIVARAKLITEQEQLVKRTSFLSVFQKDDRIAHNAHVQTTKQNQNQKQATSLSAW